MSYAAFIYTDYDGPGIKSAFAGYYDTERDAKEVLRGGRYDRHRGGRYDRQNLEIMNVETLGFTAYRWLPLYEDKQMYVPAPEMGSTRLPISKITLTHRWDKTKPVLEFLWDGDTRGWNEGNIYYQAGEWKS